MASRKRPRRQGLRLGQALEQWVPKLREAQVWLLVATQGILRRQQTHDCLGGVPQLGVALQIFLDADRLSGFEAKLKVGMNQLDQHGLALDELLGQIGVDNQRLALSQGSLETSDDPFQFGGILGGELGDPVVGSSHGCLRAICGARE